MRRAIWVGITMLVAGLVGPGPDAAHAACFVPLFAYRHGTVVFSEGGRVVRVRVEIADTPERQEIGLMCRTILDPDAGMLFMYPDITWTQFWMKNTFIPLSIAFIDPRWHIVRIMEMAVAPDPVEGPFIIYDPAKPYRYALEVNRAFFTKHELDEHAEVRFVPSN
jgi:uncharacterized membrane protein (UPF0127 family)